MARVKVPAIGTRMRGLPRSRRLLVVLFFAGLVLPAAEAAAPAPKPVEPQPAATALRDGLRADLYFGRFQDIAQLEQVIAATPQPPATAILPHLDWAWGAGNVLGTTSSDLVGARITGLIFFDRPGLWQLRVTSNDGVRLTLGNVKLFEDPEVHSDSESEALPVTIAAAGWYPLEILYFEKKGTATLKLHWVPPAATAFTPVPASALRHLP